MSYCTDPLKKCEEPPTTGQRIKNSWKGIALTCVVTGMGIAAARSPMHNPAVIIGFGVGGLAIAAACSTATSSKEALSRSKEPCTTLFDAYRFKVPPNCYTLPREKPLIFYANEPLKPEPEDPWFQHIPYDNVPKPNCCKKPPPPEAKEPFKSEMYVNVPKGGKCPP